MGAVRPAAAESFPAEDIAEYLSSVGLSLTRSEHFLLPTARAHHEHVLPFLWNDNCEFLMPWHLLKRK